MPFRSPPRWRHGAFLAMAAIAISAPIRAWSLTAPSPPPTPTRLWLGYPGVDIRAARSRRHEKVAAWLQWERATTLENYQRVGERDPAWDADACECLGAYAHSFAPSPDDGKGDLATATAAVRRALTKGCTDPLVHYVALRLVSAQLAHPATGNGQVYAEAEAALEKSGYAAVRKCYASFRAASFGSDGAPQGLPSGQWVHLPPASEVADSLERTVKHLVEVLRDPSVPSDALFDLTDAIFEFAENDQQGELKIFAPLEEAFASGVLKETPETAALRMAEGSFWIHYAWRARSSKWAGEVTDEGWQLFEKRLSKAQVALERAHELDPADPRICDSMMTVELGQGEGRERMETWFRRAMDADPDNARACHKKMYYLEPKWYGSEEEMLEFGRQCLATGNWAGRLPWLLEDAHITLAGNQTDEAAWQAYWKEPAVWKDMHDLYEAALEANPDSTFIRSRYARAAVLSEHWKLADALFNELGDKVDLTALSVNQKRYEEMRRQAAERARGD